MTSPMLGLYLYKTAQLGKTVVRKKNQEKTLIHMLSLRVVSSSNFPIPFLAFDYSRSSFIPISIVASLKFLSR